MGRQDTLGPPWGGSLQQGGGLGERQTQRERWERERGERVGQREIERERAGGRAIEREDRQIEKEGEKRRRE